MNIDFNYDLEYDRKEHTARIVKSTHRIALIAVLAVLELFSSRFRKYKVAER